MKLKLYQNNRRSEPVRTSTLKELLDSPEPFVISNPKDNKIRKHIVYSELHPAPEWLLGGLLVIDHDKNKRYFVKRGQHQFEEHEGTGGPWHSDKFGIYANFYELLGSFKDLTQEFENLGFCF